MSKKDNYLRPSLTFDFSAKVSHVGLPSVYLSIYFLVPTSPIELKFKKTNSSNFYPLTKVYFRETYKSQNINHIYLNPQFTFGIIRIIANACQVCLLLSLIKTIFLHLQISISYLSIQPQRSMVCVNSKCYLACWSTLIHFNLICNTTSFRKEKMPFDTNPGVEDVYNDSIFAFIVLCSQYPLNLICSMTTFRK